MNKENTVSERFFLRCNTPLYDIQGRRKGSVATGKS